MLRYESTPHVSASKLFALAVKAQNLYYIKPSENRDGCTGAKKVKSEKNEKMKRKSVDGMSRTSETKVSSSAVRHYLR